MRGVLVTFCVLIVLDLSPETAVGLLSGAVTNTPSLPASSQGLSEIYPAESTHMVSSAGMAYAVAYPFGILGIILCMILIRVFFRISPDRELEKLKEMDAILHPPLHTRTFCISNPNLDGLRLKDIRIHIPHGLVLSRVKEPESAAIHAATENTELCPGMLVHAVGQEEELHKLRLLLGPESDVNLREEPGPLEVRSLLVTKSNIAGKSVRALGLTPESGVTVTRIVRAGVEFAAGPGVHLHYGDKLLCVGEATDLERAASVLGHSAKALAHPHVPPVFLGLPLAVILGSLPFAVPRLPYGVKLGLAGGPLLAAIILSRINHFAGMIWYLPTGSNLILREMGISLFLACVGLNSGAGFVDTLTRGDGLLWMAAGACITFLPLFLVSLLARLVLRYDYASICGLLAGSMTDPPALAFSVQMLGSDAPSSVYASVYPLTMILRILFAQLLVLALYYMT